MKQGKKKEVSKKIKIKKGWKKKGKTKEGLRSKDKK